MDGAAEWPSLLFHIRRRFHSLEHGFAKMGILTGRVQRLFRVF